MRAVAIIHEYDDDNYNEQSVTRREIVGVVLQKPKEGDLHFDNRVEAIVLRLKNLTHRDKYADADPESLLLAAAYIDFKVYSGHLEIETTEILEV